MFIVIVFLKLCKADVGFYQIEPGFRLSISNIMLAIRFFEYPVFCSSIFKIFETSIIATHFNIKSLYLDRVRNPWTMLFLLITEHLGYAPYWHGCQLEKFFWFSFEIHIFEKLLCFLWTDKFVRTMFVIHDKRITKNTNSKNVFDDAFSN